jgi:hypothetical protein
LSREDGGRVGALQEAVRTTSMASSSKASHSLPERSEVRAASPHLRLSISRSAGPIPLIWSVSISSCSCFPVWGAMQPPDQGMGRDAVTASVVAIRSKLAQLKREIQSGRLAYIKVSAGADHVAGISRRGLWFGLLNSAVGDRRDGLDVCFS